MHKSHARNLSKARHYSKLRGVVARLVSVWPRSKEPVMMILLALCIFVLPGAVHALTGVEWIIAAQSGLFIGAAVGGVRRRNIEAIDALLWCLPSMYSVAFVSHWYVITVVIISGCWCWCDFPVFDQLTHFYQNDH